MERIGRGLWFLVLLVRIVVINALMGQATPSSLQN